MPKSQRYQVFVSIRENVVPVPILLQMEGTGDALPRSRIEMRLAAFCGKERTMKAIAIVWHDRYWRPFRHYFETRERLNQLLQ